MPEKRELSLADLFPPPGHRYLTDERIEAFRVAALQAESVTFSSFTVMEIVCDLRNMAAQLDREEPDGR